MKKTMIAMLAMAGAAFATEADQIDWTFSNYMSNLDPSTASALTQYYTSSGIQFSLTADSTAYKATASEGGAELPDWLFLDSVTLHTVNNANSNMYGILCDSAGNVVTVSDNKSTCSAQGDLTFNFSDTKVVMGEKYEIVFFSSVQQDHQGMLNYIANNNWSYAAGSTNTAHTNIQLPALTLNAGSGSGYTGDGTILMMNGNKPQGMDSTSLFQGKQYMPAITITAHTPEPATATLSLLALAALAARRKRS